MRKSVILLLLASTLAACGLKGPLYIPAPKPVATAPAAPAPAVDDKKGPESK